MRIHLILISLIICSFSALSGSLLFDNASSSPALVNTWVLEDNANTLSLITKKEGDKLKINYCFIFNQGRKINCMDDGEYQEMEANDECFFSKKIRNVWDDKKFNLSICMNGKSAQWLSSSGEYIPKKINLLKENH